MNRLFIISIVISSALFFVSTAYAQRVNPRKGPDGCQKSLEMCIDDFTQCQSATCGNDVAEYGEECDGENLQGATCISEGFTYGTLSCNSSCQYDTSGCTDNRFTDNGDGTVTDNDHCLMWEKKTDDGSIHDKDNSYDWSENTLYTATGTVFTDFLNILNNTCHGANHVFCADDTTCAGVLSVCGFAGFRDWRLPSVYEDGGTEELETIIDYTKGNCGGGSGPCIDETIFGPTSTSPYAYWSATTDASLSSQAWTVLFLDGSVGKNIKTTLSFARAVRGCN